MRTLTCLSDAQIAALVAYAKGGGRLVCTGDSGRYDERNRQRFSNPLKAAVAGLANVAWRDAHDMARNKYMTHIKYALYPPEKGVRPLMEDLAKAGFKPQVEVISAPEAVFAQFKRDDAGRVVSVHFLNYEFRTPVSGVRIRVPTGVVPTFAAPFEGVRPGGAPREVEPGVWELPPFAKYAYFTL